MKFHSIFLLVATATAASLPLEKRLAGTAYVDVSDDTGTPAHLASGFIYGIPDTALQIPDSFYTGIGFNHARAGGAQVPAPGRGWIWGLTEYKNRFASVLSNYKTARRYSASFILLIHDLWGADGTQNSTAPYPGDNGVWTSWDNYLTQLISDINANSMTAGLSIDIWNEPDLTIFWNREQSQWLQMYGRTYHRLRTAFPSALLLGPTLANSPSTSDTWWTNFLSFVKTNSSGPDQYVWHIEGGGDLQIDEPVLTSLLSTYGLPTKTINIDEYATYAEQVPCGAAWWISRLERANAIGLRGNWLSGWSLHDFMASLLGKPNAGTSSYSETATGYWPNGEWQVYHYYYTNMTGYRVSTTGSTDRIMDAYATVGTDKVRILVGSRETEGTWDLTISGLASLGLGSSGTVAVQTWGFPDTGGHFGDVAAPTNLGIVDHTFTSGSVTWQIYQVDTTTAYAFEFAV